MDTQERQLIKQRTKEVVKQATEMETSTSMVSYAYLYGVLGAVVEVRDIEYCRVFFLEVEREINRYYKSQRVFS